MKHNANLLKIGLEYLKIKDYDNAIYHFKKLLGDKFEMNAETKEVIYHLGEAYIQKGMLKEAEEVYGYILEDDYLYRDVKDKIFEVRKKIKEKDEKSSRYKVIEEVGRGGMGIVYRADDLQLGRTVALKTIAPYLLSEQDSLKRFLQEAKIAASLTHPNIIRIFDVGEFEGKKCICMEYIEGGSLRKLIEGKGKVQLNILLPIAVQICEALNYAHSQGIIHRDIKPDNILLTKDNIVKITDFGIAKIFHFPKLTQDGKTLGTLTYVSPEQILGEEIDERSDIYSFGITLYEALSGKPPFFEGDITYQHLHSEPKKIDGILGEVNELISRCLRKNKTERYSNCREILEVLKAITNNQ